MIRWMVISTLTGGMKNEGLGMRRVCAKAHTPPAKVANIINSLFTNFYGFTLDNGSRSDTICRSKRGSNALCSLVLDSSSAQSAALVSFNHVSCFLGTRQYMVRPTSKTPSYRVGQ